MARLIPLLLGILLAAVRSRSALVLENLALRQQVAVLKRKRPRPFLNRFDRLFWTTLRLASISTRNESVNENGVFGVEWMPQANRIVSFLFPNQGIGVGWSARPEATR